MWLRRAIFGWLIPAAFVLPLWMLVGWVITGAGGWALLWVLLIAIPGVFVWQLILSLLVRARGTVRAERAVSWWDVLGFAAWHALVISLGFFAQAWWGATLVAAIAVGIAVFWMALWQLWREARPSRMILRTAEGIAYVPPTMPRAAEDAPEVVVVTERPGASSSCRRGAFGGARHPWQNRRLCPDPALPQGSCRMTLSSPASGTRHPSIPSRGRPVAAAERNDHADPRLRRRSIAAIRHPRVRSR